MAARITVRTDPPGAPPGVVGYITGRDATYPEDLWVERDNFPTFARAADYARHMARTYSVTPYRIKVRYFPLRYCVEYVPEWKLR